MTPVEPADPTKPAESSIPIEIRARVEANAFFDAILEGDYARAARAQERIQRYGFRIGRTTEKPPRKPRRQPREVA